MNRKNYMEKYRETHKKQQRGYEKKWREKHKEKLRKYRKKNRDKVNKLKNKIFGNKCKICGKNNKLVLHEIHGRKHPELKSLKVILSLSPKDFIRLCKFCHEILHRLKERNGNFEKFARLGTTLE